MLKHYTVIRTDITLSCNFPQVLYVGGAMLGGLLSSSLSRTLATEPGVPIQFAIPGGFLLIFGSRFAAGCTRCVEELFYPGHSGIVQCQTQLAYMSNYYQFLHSICTSYIIKKKKKRIAKN